VQHQKSGFRLNPEGGLFFFFFGFFSVITVFFLKLFHPSGTVDEFLFSGKKRVALGANFHPDFIFGGSGFKGIAAGTDYLAFFIIRMDIFSHINSPQISVFLMSKTKISIPIIPNLSSSCQ
jgi:hypothetical protein